MRSNPKVPIPNQGESIIDIKNCIVLKNLENTYADQKPYNYPIKKLIFFLFREGLFLTVRKVKFTLIKNRILKNRKIILAIGQLNNQKVIAVGPIDNPNYKKFSFPKTCIVPLDENIQIDKVAKLLNSILTNKDQYLYQLSNYSYYSKIPLDFNLKHIIQEHMKSLPRP